MLLHKEYFNQFFTKKKRKSDSNSDEIETAEMPENLGCFVINYVWLDTATAKKPKTSDQPGK